MPETERDQFCIRNWAHFKYKLFSMGFRLLFKLTLATSSSEFLDFSCILYNRDEIFFSRYKVVY